jgi:hypothetical protein
MITTNPVEHTNTETSTTNTATSTQAPADTIAEVALDKVSGGYLYNPYAGANPYGYGPGPYAANPYRPYAMANPYAYARYEARLERRAAWYQNHFVPRWWGY